MNRISAYFRRMQKTFDHYPNMPRGRKRTALYLHCAMGRAAKHMSIEEYCYYYGRIGKPDCWRRAFNRDKAWAMWSLNDKAAVDRLMDKAGCLRRYHDFVYREWLEPNRCTVEEFLDFARRQGRYVVKPRAAGRGEGVYISEYVSDATCAEEYKNFCRQDAIVEEIIHQHDAMGALYPDSVNTVRIASVLTEDGPVLLSSCMRVGNGGVIDNFCKGGMTAQVDFETGRIETNAVDQQHRVHEVHPITGQRFIGYQLPHWELLKKTVIEMAKVDPDAIFVGWDMAITPDGVDMVECNNNQGFGWQYALGTDWRRAYREADKKARAYYNNRHRKA